MENNHEKNDSIFNLLAGTFCNKLVNCVIQQSSNILDDKTSPGENCRRLKELWLNNIHELGGLPFLEKVVDNEYLPVVSKIKHYKYTEYAQPIGKIFGCSGRPSTYMAYPSFPFGNSREGVYVDYILKKGNQSIASTLPNPRLVVDHSESSRIIQLSLLNYSSSFDDTIKLPPNCIPRPLPFLGFLMRVIEPLSTTSTSTVTATSILYGRVIRVYLNRDSLHRTSSIPILRQRRSKNKVLLRFSNGEEVSFFWPSPYLPDSWYAADNNSNNENSTVNYDNINNNNNNNKIYSNPIHFYDSILDNHNSYKTTDDNFPTSSEYFDNIDSPIYTQQQHNHHHHHHHQQQQQQQQQQQRPLTVSSFLMSDDNDSEEDNKDNDKDPTVTLTSDSSFPYFNHSLPTPISKTINYLQESLMDNDDFEEKMNNLFEEDANGQNYLNISSSNSTSDPVFQPQSQSQFNNIYSSNNIPIASTTNTNLITYNNFHLENTVITSNSNNTTSDPKESLLSLLELDLWNEFDDDDIIPPHSDSNSMSVNNTIELINPTGKPLQNPCSEIDNVIWQTDMDRESEIYFENMRQNIRIGKSKIRVKLTRDDPKDTNIARVLSSQENIISKKSNKRKRNNSEKNDDDEEEEEETEKAKLPYRNNTYIGSSTSSTNINKKRKKQFGDIRADDMQQDNTLLLELDEYNDPFTPLPLPDAFIVAHCSRISRSSVEWKFKLTDMYVRINNNWDAVMSHGTLILDPSMIIA